MIFESDGSKMFPMPCGKLDNVYIFVKHQYSWKEYILKYLIVGGICSAFHYEYLDYLRNVLGYCHWISLVYVGTRCYHGYRVPRGVLPVRQGWRRNNHHEGARHRNEVTGSEPDRG